MVFGLRPRNTVKYAFIQPIGAFARTYYDVVDEKTIRVYVEKVAGLKGIDVLIRYSW